MPLLISIFLALLSSTPLYFLTIENRNLVYPLCSVQGVAMAIMMNTATSLISDVIGNDSKNSAFVYGSYNLFAGCTYGGLLYWIISKYTSSETPEEKETSEKALRLIMAFCPVIAATIAYVCTYLGNKFFSHKLSKITGVLKK